jgi:hypothetical protein
MKSLKKHLPTLAAVACLSVGIGLLASDTAEAVSDSDSVSVTAAVSEYITLTTSDLSMDLGTVSASTNGSDTDTLTVATNASNGWDLAAEDQTTGDTLTHTDTATKINYVTDGDTTISTGTTEWGIKFTGGAGNPSNYRNVAVSENVAGAGTPTAGNTTTALYEAAVSATQKAGTYSTTITYTATTRP